MNKEKYYMVENVTIGKVRFRKTKEGKDKIVEMLKGKGYEVKVSVKYI